MTPEEAREIYLQNKNKELETFKHKVFIPYVTQALERGWASFSFKVRDDEYSYKSAKGFIKSLTEEGWNVKLYDRYSCSWMPDVNRYYIAVAFEKKIRWIDKILYKVCKKCY